MENKVTVYGFKERDSYIILLEGYCEHEQMNTELESMAQVKVFGGQINEKFVKLLLYVQHFGG